MSALGYQEDQPTREDIDATVGDVALEFGANWCGICRAAKPHLDAALTRVPHLRRIKVADGRGLPLGRSFGVKLWPTLVLLRDGLEVGRVVRPTGTGDVQDELRRVGFFEGQQP